MSTDLFPPRFKLRDARRATPVVLQGVSLQLWSSSLFNFINALLLHGLRTLTVLWSCLLLSWETWSFFWLLVSSAEGLEFAVRCWAVCCGCWFAVRGVCQRSQCKHLSTGRQQAPRSGPSSPGGLFLTQYCLIVRANNRCGFHWFRVPQRFRKANQVDYCHPCLWKGRQFYKGHCFCPTAFFRKVL